MRFLPRLYLCLLALLLFAGGASASHYRGASISYELDSANNLTVTVFAVWRTTFIGGVSIQLFADADSNRTAPLLTMTQTSVTITETGNEYPGGEAFTVRKHVFQNNLGAFAAGFYYARWRSGTRVAGIANVGSTDWAVETRVNLSGTANSSPVMVPATIDMVARGLDWSQNLFASDPDKGSLNYQFIIGATNPQWGPTSQIPGLTIDSNGQLFIPAASTAALANITRYAYKVRVTDSSGAYAERDVLVVSRDVDAGQFQPVLQTIGDKFVNAGSTLSFTVSSTDANAGDTLTLRITTTPPGVMFPTVTGSSSISSTFTWTNATPPGIYTAGIEVFDGIPSVKTVLLDNELFKIFVLGSNQFPTLDPIGNKFVLPNKTLTFVVGGSDPETSSGNLIFTASFLPPGASFNSTTRTFTWTPTAGQKGVWPGIVFRVTDDDATTPLYAEESIIISVGANQSPNLNSIANQSVVVGTTFSAIFQSTDPDGGDLITISLPSAPPSSLFTSTPATAPSTASASLSWIPTTTGTFSFTVSSKDNGNPVLNQNRSFQVMVVSNTTPNTPTSLSPIGGINTLDSTPLLSFVLDDPDGNTVKYQLQLSTDPNFASSIVDYTSVLQSTGAASFTVGQAAGGGSYLSGSTSTLLSSGNYYWKARAIDQFSLISGYSTSGNSSIAFIINSTPNSPTITTPAGAYVVSNPPSLQFSISDPDGDSVGYRIQISSNSGFATVDADLSSGLSAPGSFTTQPGTLNAAQYYWRVRAFDVFGFTTNYTTANGGGIGFVIDASPSDPASLIVTGTDHGNVVHTLTPTMTFAIADADSQVRYRILITSGASTVVDFTSGLSASGHLSFTVGQSPGSGAYATGSVGQNLVSGTYAWSVTAISQFGPTSGTVAGSSFVVNNPPTISSLSPNSPNSFFRTTENGSFQFTIADSDSDLINYMFRVYKLDGTLVYTTGPGSFQSPGTVTLATTPFGSITSYYWTVQSTDAHSSVSGIATATGPGFIVLSQTPSTSIISPNLMLTTQPGSPPFRFAIDDPENDPVRYTITLSSFPGLGAVGTHTETSLQAEGIFQVSGGNLAVSTRGDYLWKVQGIDAGGPITGAGNIAYSTSANRFAFTVNRLPTLSSFSLSDSFIQATTTFTTSTSPSFSFNFADTDPDPVKYRLIIDDAPDFLSPVIDYTSPVHHDNYALATASANLIQHWPFDRVFSTTTPSALTTGTNLTLTSPPVHASGVHGRGFHFDGSEYMRSDVNGPLDSLKQFTVGGWIFPTVSTYTSDIGLFVQPGVIGLFFDNGQSTLQLYTSGGGAVTATYPSTAMGTWTHVAGVGTGTTLKVYINGIAQTLTFNGSGPHGSHYGANGGIFEVGGNIFSSPGAGTEAFPFEGSMDDVRVYNKALSDAEMLQLVTLLPTSASGSVGHAIGATGAQSSFLHGLTTTTLPGAQYFYQIQAIDVFNDVSTTLSGNFIVNTTPAAPTLVSPLIGQTTTSTAPALSFQYSDPEGNRTQYLVEVALNNNFNSPTLRYRSALGTAQSVQYVIGQAAGSGTYLTGGAGTTLAHGSYNWRATVTDEWGFTSPVSTAASATAFIVNQPPGLPVLTAPQSSSIQRSTQPGLTFTTSDADADNVTYTLSIDDDSNMSSPLITYTRAAAPGAQSFTVGQAVGSGTYAVGSAGGNLSSGNYYWSVSVVDAFSDSGGSVQASTSPSGFAFKVNQIPTAASSLTPSTGAGITTRTPTLTFNTSDPEGDSIGYVIEISSSASFAAVDIKYQSALVSAGAQSFSVGQAAGTGTYLTGSAGTGLNEASYYWRVLVYDQHSVGTGLTTTANSGAVAFVLDTSPIFSGVAEISPGNAIQSTNKSFVLSLSTIYASTSTGFNRIVLSVPTGYTVPATPVSGITVGGVATAFTASIAGQTITLNLGSTVASSTKTVIGLDLLTPASTQLDTFAVSVLHTTFSESQALIEGDGDGLSNGGSLKVLIQSSGAALLTLAEISPNQTTQASATDFILSLFANFDPTTSGVDIIELDLPASYVLLKVGAVTINGVAIAYTSTATAANHLEVKLPSIINSNSKFTVAFNARAPLAPSTDTFSAGKVRTSSPAASTNITEGDGDQNGSNRTLIVQTVPQGTVLAAEAEVLPPQVFKGTTGVNFSLYINTLADPSTSGVTRIQFHVPTELAAPSVSSVRFAGSSLSHSATVSGNTVTVTLVAANNLSGVYRIDVTANSDAKTGSSAISSITVSNTAQLNSSSVSVGDGDNNGSVGTLSISRIPAGVASAAFGETMPQILFKNDTSTSTLFLNVTVGSADSGFNRVRFTLPHFIESANVLSVKFNGTSIAHTSDAHTIAFSSNGGDTPGVRVYVAPSSTITSSGILAVGLRLKTHNEEETDILYDARIAYSTDSTAIYNTTNASERVVLDGDGDGVGGPGSMRLASRSAGPAASAAGEILPVTYTKGISNRVDYYIRPVIEPRHSGVTRLEIPLASNMSSPSQLDVKVNGTSAIILDSSPSANPIRILISTVSSSAVIDVGFNALFNSDTGFFYMPEATVDYTTHSSLAASSLSTGNILITTGDGDFKADGGALRFQTLPAGPVVDVISEITPNTAIKSTTSDFSYHFNAVFDASSSGVDTLFLQLPSSFGSASQLKLQLNGSAVAFTDLSGTDAGGQKFLKAKLGTIVKSNAILTMLFRVTLPVTPIQETLGIAWVDDSSFTFPRTVREGDGDGLGNGGSLSIHTVALAAVLSAFSEIQPSKATKSATVDFTYHTAFVTDAQTSGVDAFSLTLPATYSGVTLLGVKRDGSSISYTNTSAGQVLSATLGQTITASSLLELSLRATMPAIEDIENIPGILLKNIASALSTTATKGDGDGKKDGGTLSVTTVAAGPATQAVAEVRPVTVIKASTDLDFSYSIDAILDASSSQIARVDLSVPASFTSPVLRNVRVNGASIAYTSSVSNNIFRVNLTSALTSSSLIALDFRANSPIDIRTEAFQPAVLYDNTSRSLSASEGATSATTDLPHSWSVTTRSSGAGRDIVSEIVPTVSRLNEKTRFSLHNFVIQDVTSSPVKRFTLDLPQHFSAPAFVTAQVNGSSVSAITSISNQTLEVLFTDAISSTSIITLVFDATPTLAGSETLSRGTAWSVWGSALPASDIKTDIRAGDGDLGRYSAEDTLTLTVLSSAAVLKAPAEIQPNLVPTSSVITFHYDIALQLGSTSDGVGYFELDLPSGYTQASIVAIQKNGTSLSFSTSSGTSTLKASWSDLIKTDARLRVVISARSPASLQTDLWSLARVGTSSSSTLLGVVQGDGDGQGAFGANSLSVQTVANLPVESATVEIYPNFADKDIATTFHLLSNLKFNAGSSGVTSVEFQLPASYTTGSISSLRMSGQNIAFASSVDTVHRIYYATPTTTVNTDTLLEIIFTATPTLGFGVDILATPQLVNGATKIKPFVGDTDNRSISSRNNLSVFQRSRGAVESLTTEVEPGRVAAGLSHTFHVHSLAVLGKSPTFGGIDQIEFKVPSGFISPALSAVKVDGSSVSFTNQSSGQALKALLGTVLSSDPVVNRQHVITMTFSATVPSAALVEAFSQLRVWLSSAPTVISHALEGDGDLDIMGSLTNRWGVKVSTAVPAATLLAECYPNRLKTGHKTQSLDLYVYAKVGVGNSGISEIEIQQPASLTLTRLQFDVNETIVGTNTSSGSSLRYHFSPAINFDAVFRFQMTVDVGNTAFADAFSAITIKDSLGNILNAEEGDGDQGRFSRGANHWNIELAQNVVATYVRAALSPHTFDTSNSSLQVFSYIAHVVIGSGDSGFDTLRLGIPSTLNNLQFDGLYIQPNPGTNPSLTTALASQYRTTGGTLSINGVVQVGGLTKASSLPASSMGLSIVLNSVITTSSLVELRFRALSATEFSTPEEFSNFAILNSAVAGSYTTAQLTNLEDWLTSALVPRAVLEARAEITPNQVTVSSTSDKTTQSYSYYVSTTQSLSSGYNRIRFRFPTTYSNFSYQGIFQYAQIGATATALAGASASLTGNQLTIDLASSLTQALLEVRFSATAPTVESFERFSLVDFINIASNNPVQVIEGNTGLRPNSSSHSLRVDVKNPNIVSNILAEINPSSVTTPKKAFPFTYEVFLDFNANSTGVNHLQLNLPAYFIGARLQGFTVNGAQILYEDQSYYKQTGFADIEGGFTGGSIVIKLPNALTSDSRLSLYMTSDFRPDERDVNVSQFFVSKTPLDSNTVFFASEGDGGAGSSNSWKFQLKPPSAGLRNPSDYPLILANSGDYATPLVVGYGFPGESATILSGTTTLGTGTVDATGFYAVRTSLLAEGNHSLVARLSNLAGAVTATSDTRSHTVFALGQLPTLDSDGDGFPDIDDADDDADGILDVFDRYPLDHDNDGLPDAGENDPDGDGVTDVQEALMGSLRLNPDTNGDGIRDRFDLTNSDGDGLVDVVDPQPTVSASVSDSDGDGLPDALDDDADGDGIPNKLDLYPYDTDNDGLNNFLDPDDDQDGVSDGTEIALGTDPLNRDTNGDGVPDRGISLDTDGDGLIDGIDPDPINPLRNDLDGDGIPDNEDLDMDGDGIENRLDRFPCDYDNDGSNDYLNPDDDNDGISDHLDPWSRDTDNDGIPNHLDPDDDGDGTPDPLDPWPLDANNDGNIDGLGQAVYYGDRDGVRDVLEVFAGTDSRNADTNGDGKRDSGMPWASGDSDGDGVPDEIDSAPQSANFDSDGNGFSDSISDYLTRTATASIAAIRHDSGDADGDGLLNAHDRHPFDSDNDGLPNASDGDDDGDGIPDTSDSHPLDSDNDGLRNKLETDADGDGLSDTLERLLLSSVHRNDEPHILRPSTLHLDVSSNPRRTKPLSLSYDWSRITGRAADNALTVDYDDRALLLPVAPVWSVAMPSETSDIPADHTALLWGQMDLKLNGTFRSGKIKFRVPLSDELVRDGRKLEFTVHRKNLKGQWEAVSHTSTQAGQSILFEVPWHTSLRIYYKDFGVTKASDENSGGGGCFLDSD